MLICDIWFRMNLLSLELTYSLFKALNEAVRVSFSTSIDAEAANLRNRIRRTIMILFSKTARMMDSHTIAALWEDTVAFLLAPMAS
jgi:RNase P protein component